MCKCTNLKDTAGHSANIDLNVNFAKTFFTDGTHEENLAQDDDEDEERKLKMDIAMSSEGETGLNLQKKKAVTLQL